MGPGFHGADVQLVVKLVVKLAVTGARKVWPWRRVAYSVLFGPLLK